MQKIFMRAILAIVVTGLVLSFFAGSLLVGYQSYRKWKFEDSRSKCLQNSACTVNLTFVDLETFGANSTAHVTAA